MDNKQKAAAWYSGMSFSAKILGVVLLAGILTVIVGFPTVVGFAIAMICIFTPSVVVGVANTGVSMIKHLLVSIGKLLEWLFNAIGEIINKDDDNEKR